MAITTKQKQQLKAQAHKLKPIVGIGHQGLTESVINEINRALDDHELIKVRINAERDERKELYAAVCEATGAEALNLIGGIAIIYRKSEDKEV
jgi:RNA-binding protein